LVWVLQVNRDGVVVHREQIFNPLAKRPFILTGVCRIANYDLPNLLLFKIRSDRSYDPLLFFGRRVSDKPDGYLNLKSSWVIVLKRVVSSVCIQVEILRVAYEFKKLRLFLFISVLPSLDPSGATSPGP
jgi:hypothetical protein